MSVRAIKARILCDRTTLEHLWRTHRVFNQRLPEMISVLTNMRRGKYGTNKTERGLYKQIAEFILASPARNAHYLLNSVSMTGWKPASAKKYKVKRPAPSGELIEVTGAVWADEAAKLSAAGKLVFDKKKLLGDLPDTLRRMISHDAVAILRGHDELLRIWRREHEEWLAKKAKWEDDPEHKKYLALRPEFEKFEQDAGGKAAKRRGRWHKYLDWLRRSPHLAAWRGATAKVYPISPDAEKKIRSARPSRQRTVEAEEFWKTNPELAALNRLHGYYEREFVRRRKRKRNPDGFDHRPTFTLPDPVRHPRWFSFNAPQTKPQGYKELSLPAAKGKTGSIRLRLLTGEKTGGKFPNGWVTVRFKADPRLADFRACKVRKAANKRSIKGQETEKPAFQFLDRQLNQLRPAQISGVKPIFRDVRLNADGSLRSANPFLTFACNIDDERLSDLARKIVWSETGETTKKGKLRKKIGLPEGLVACSVDLGVRHLGFATIAQYHDGKVNLLRSRNIWIGHEETEGAHPGRWSKGPDLAHLASHKRKIRKLRRQRGKPVHGESSHVELQQHITHLAEDRFKKGARAIVNFALNADGAKSGKSDEPYPRADVLVLESLDSLLPDAERERGINRALIAFNRGHLVDRVKEVAKDCGLRVVMVSPYGTSQVCSKCGALGRRYSVRRDAQTRLPEIHFGMVEKLFACECGHRANSDHNASVNLHRRLLLGDEAVKFYLDWKDKPEPERRQILEGLESRLRPALRKLHGLDALTIDSIPF